MNPMINRQKLIEEFTKWRDVFEGKEDNMYILMQSVIEEIESQPPANVPDTNVGEWIPCSERLPNKEEYLKDDGRFIVTDGNRRYQGLFDIYDGKFKHDRFDCILEEDKCVIAWQPLPEPYKGVE